MQQIREIDRLAKPALNFIDSNPQSFTREAMHKAFVGDTISPRQQQEKIMNTFRLGNIVKDRATGFTGMVTRISESISGYGQYCVMPEAKENSFPDGVFIDPQILELVSDGIANELTPPEHDWAELKLGTKVKDKYTAFNGTVVMRVWELNGCLQVVVNAEKLHEGKLVTEVFGAPSVEVIKAVAASPKKIKTGPAPRRSSSIGRGR